MVSPNIIHTVRSGGIAEAISKMSFGNFIGVKLNDELQKKDFFKPEYGSFVLELMAHLLR